MPFNTRIHQANSLIEIMNNEIWNKAGFNDRFIIAPYGYETHIQQNVRTNLINSTIITAQFIRFTPDFFLIDMSNPDAVHFLEYKLTWTPLYSSKRINHIKKHSGVADLTANVIGQMEAAAYDSYISIVKIGVRVAILNYCSYHHRPLLCKFVENIKLLFRDNVSTLTYTGSGTPYINFDCRSLRTFQDFMSEEHDVRMNDAEYDDFLRVLKVRFP
jgi:hypothetical protein